MRLCKKNGSIIYYIYRICRVYISRVSIDPKGLPKLAAPRGAALLAFEESSLDVKQPGGSREPEGPARGASGSGGSYPFTGV